MLRLPPTIIGLGRSDIKDYDKRRELAQRKEKKTSFIVNKTSYVIPKRFTAVAYRPVARHTSKSVAGTSSKKNRLSFQSNSLTPISSLDNEVCSYLSQHGHIKYSHIPASISSDDIVTDNFDTHSSAESSFYFGGSVQNLPENYHQDSSSFSISKPRIYIPSQCLPLNHPYNGINPPECYLESGLVPHVVSRGTSHNSSGILFSQLSKRKGKRPNRATICKEYDNSHESSESSSVICEHDRDSMISDSDMISSSKELSRLHKKFSSISLRSSGDFSAGSILSQSPSQEGICSSRDTTGLTNYLILPPSFSNMPRRFSATGSLPGTKLSSRPEKNFKGTNTSQNFNMPGQKNETEMQSLTLTDYLRVISQGLSPRYSLLQESLEHLDINDKSQLELIPQTPSRSYKVYNDNLTPKIQPQTPANLPEYRHRSRYHPSFTAPDSQRYRRRCSVTGVIDEFRNSSRYQPNPVVGRSSDYRNIASFDLDIDGFDSHFGAINNSDEE